MWRMIRPTSLESFQQSPLVESPATTPQRGTRQSMCPFLEAHSLASTPRSSPILSSRNLTSVTIYARGAATSHVLIRLVQCVIAALALTTMMAEPARASALASEGGSIGVRLVDVPANATNDPRARMYIVDHLAPGTVIHRRIEISNTTAATEHVELYSAAAAIKKGSFLGAAGRTRNDLSTWISVRPRSAESPRVGS
jgi:hypothetical protein